MSILSKSREEIERDIKDGYANKKTLLHYDLCKAMAQGLTQEAAAEKFNLTDDRYVRLIKSKKCPDCNKIH